MIEQLLDEIDPVYEKYGYEIKRYKSTRVYLFTKSIYNGAEIIGIEGDSNIERLRQEYSAEGYAVKVRHYSSSQDAEITLFKDFFKADGVIQTLQRRYRHFVSRLMEKLPDNAQYEYVKSPYEYTYYRDNGNNEAAISITVDDNSNDLISKVVSLIDKHNGPLLIIIEAAAGYGKTCTAYEILNDFLKLSLNKIPFFTELSRDRKATIFKHILHNEIEEQFANRVDSKVVISQIKQGRIPLIIDGFDELISKDFSFSSSKFEKVENMLSTIVDLLSDNAKIVITSRRTAIFNSEEFLNWMDERNITYSMARITITEPSLENWLSREKINLIRQSGFPLEQISNPVLLTYIKHTAYEELEPMILKKQSIVNKYFNFLLEREQVRQDLLIEPETQLRIFKKLARVLSEFDIKSANKEDMQDFLLSYNRKILDETVKKYTPDKRPRVDQLASTLSNHAFLDRKDNGSIGFINDFVLGTLVGQNLVSGKYLEHNNSFNRDLSQAYAYLAVDAFLVQANEEQLKLWQIFNSYEFDYDQQFFFKIDTVFKSGSRRTYRQATLGNFSVNNMIFATDLQFVETIFTNCVFTECIFYISSFKDCSFLNCKFFDCVFEGANYSDNNFVILGCSSNNNLTERLLGVEETSPAVSQSIEGLVFNLFWKQGALRPRHRQLSHIRNDLKVYDAKEISSALHKLKSEGFIQVDGDIAHLTKAGISYFNENYR